AKPNGQNAFQPQQAPDDDRAVGPRARASNDQPIPAGFHWIAVASVVGDAGGDVVGVAGELARPGNVGGHDGNSAAATDSPQLVRTPSGTVEPGWSRSTPPVPNARSTVPCPRTDRRSHPPARCSGLPAPRGSTKRRCCRCWSTTPRTGPRPA